MTSTATDPAEARAEYLRRQNPSYAGLSAADVTARLRNLGRLAEYVLSAVEGGDVERARDAARLAGPELAAVTEALEQAMPAVELAAEAAEARRICRPWQPVHGVVDGPPIVDDTWTDPVVVAAHDLAAMTHGWSSASRPVPAAALRACSQLARQQPARVTDLLTMAGGAYPQIRGALIRDGALPDELR